MCLSHDIHKNILEQSEVAVKANLLFRVITSELYVDKDLSFHKVYYTEECLQPSEYIAQSSR